ncbi:MAG: hypothetical protein EOO88_38030 [Pedobacter sp.]|nr:MAG: hypothetical protein EOO88_38030 [Pedobacter sp.]
MKIAFITYSGDIKYSPANGFSENTDLIPFLKNKGLNVTEEVWDDPAVDWKSYDVAILKSPWDYHQKLDSFKAWLKRISQLDVRLFNDYNTVSWNLDKRYLKEIADAGLDIIASIFLDAGLKVDLDSLFENLSSDKIIIKPCVSGGSNNTFVVDLNYSPELAETIQNLASNTDLVAQPFLEEINDGEWSLHFFNGTYSHTILKKPAPGDFRVQQMFGGTIEVPYVDTNLIGKAEAYVSKFAKDTLYARVDGVFVNGSFQLMELELIEPFLYLAYDAGAVDRYYNAVLEKLVTLNI